MINRRRGKKLHLFAVFLVLILILIELTYLIYKNWLTNQNSSCSCSSSSVTVDEKIVDEKILKSLCSTRATKRGIGQKVLSISFFGPVENPQMFQLNSSLIFLQEMINDMQQVYADNWILRIYHDEKILNKKIMSHFESRYNFIDFCNVTNIGLNYIPQKIWRFLPAVDDTVNIMASRDLDSPLTQRERAAIDEWILSNLTFHTMRDHPEHAVPMLGGMWAFRVEYDRSFSHIFRSKIFDLSFINQYSLNRDQQFLEHHLWPYAMNKAMSHASYWCTTPDWNRYHRPFPTQRPLNNLTNYCFVGCSKPCCVNWYFDKGPCPIDCRPREHQDWLYC